MDWNSQRRGKVKYVDNVYERKEGKKKKLFQ